MTLSTERKAELYDHMLAVAQANGFESITAAIARAIPAGVRVCTESDMECSRGCGAGVCKKEAAAADAAAPKCWCETCRPITMDDMRMVLCPTCGNKRCPRATHHLNTCTGSNEVGQPGSSWEHVKPFHRTETQPDERAALDNVKPLVDQWIRSRATSMNGDSYAAALQLAAHVAARAAAPQSSLVEIVYAVQAYGDARADGGDSAYAIGKVCNLLRAISTSPADHACDSARLDWLDATNARFKMGWRVGRAPAGNVSIGTVIELNDDPTPIRAAIDVVRKAEIERSGQGGKDHG